MPDLFGTIPLVKRIARSVEFLGTIRLPLPACFGGDHGWSIAEQFVANLVVE